MPDIDIRHLSNFHLRGYGTDCLSDHSRRHYPGDSSSELWRSCHPKCHICRKYNPIVFELFCEFTINLFVQFFYGKSMYCNMPVYSSTF